MICVTELHTSIGEARSVSIGTTIVSPAEIKLFRSWRKNEFDKLTVVTTEPFDLMI